VERTEIRISNAPGELDAVRQWIEAFGADQGIPPQVMIGLLVSFDEVLSNLISCGYPDRARREIVLGLSLEDGAVQGEVVDDAVPFDPLNAPAPDLSGGISERPVGGLGIHLLKELNDDITCRHEANGNRLRFRKRVREPG
jgi:serine/threonine-protein kinase RsbW